MAGYGSNYKYGESQYKDEGDSGFANYYGIEPIIIVTFENRAFVFSHRSDTLGRREYRLTEFLKRNQYKDKFMIGA